LDSLNQSKAQADQQQAAAPTFTTGTLWTRGISATEQDRNSQRTPTVPEGNSWDSGNNDAAKP
jgi:hypothetical protein